MNNDYPPHLKTATRAEFVTRIRMNQPKKGGGCRNQGANILLLVLLITIIFMII